MTHFRKALWLIAFISLWTASLAQAGEYAIVVHEKNAITGYKQAELAKVFKREVQHWGDKGQISVILPKKGTDEMNFLLDSVYSMSEKDLAKYWVGLIYQNKIAKRPKQLPVGKVLLKVVSGDENAISIARVEDLKLVKGLKVVPIDGKKPGEKGYPLVDSKKGSMARASLDASLAQDTLPVSDVARAAEAAAPAIGQDDETDARFADLEEQLLDLQIEMAGGDDSEYDTSDGPLIAIKGFSHVTAGMQDNDYGTSTRENQFALGGLDLFITSQLSENVSFLNETVFEPTEEGGYVLDVERVIFKYDVSDALNIQAGRFHTTLGDWNERYHHGEYLQTSIGRPAIFSFEDENGLLPVHLVGLVVKGRTDLSNVGVDYTFEVGNGRGATPDPPQLTIDGNSQKAFNFSFGISPDAVEGLRFGGGTYIDKIPANANAAAGSVHGEMDELILSTFVSYRTGPWEAVGEYLAIEHDEAGGAGSTSSNGWYVQFSRAFGDWRPYVRYDVTSLDDDDNFFASTDDANVLALGVRWDFAPWSALKLQYDNLDVTVTGGPDGTVNALALQVSFAF